MPTTKAVGIKDLKNNLSAHLQEVRRGARILVTDRHVVVAELREPGALPSSVLDQWASRDITHYQMIAALEKPAIGRKAADQIRILR